MVQVNFYTKKYKQDAIQTVLSCQTNLETLKHPLY